MICVSLLLFCMSFFGGGADGVSEPRTDADNDTRRYTCFVDDELYWYSRKEFTVYNLSECPLSVFEGYKRLFPVPVSVADQRGGYVRKDKNYFAVWAVIDSMLYLCDVRIDAFRNDSDRDAEREKERQYLPDNKKYRLIEKMTGEKFQMSTGGVKKSVPSKPQGVLPATWFDGVVLMKKNTADAFEIWFTTPFLEVAFRKGKVISVKEVWAPDHSRLSVFP